MPGSMLRGSLNVTRRTAERRVVEATGVEDRPGGIVTLIEQVLHQPEHLDVLRHLVGGMQVRDPVGRHLGIDVRVVADQILAAEIIDVATELPGVGDLVFRADLETVRRNPRDMIAGHNVDDGTGNRIVGRRIIPPGNVRKLW